MIEQNIRIDDILYADTGAEYPETLDFVNVFSQYTESMIGVPVTIVRYKIGIYEDCVAHRCLPAIAYGRRACSHKFKHSPQTTYIKAKYGQDVEYYMFIGFDYDELGRMRESEHKNVVNMFPLVEYKIGRKECIKICNDNGFYPSKSSCWICPSLKKREVLELMKRGDGLIDRALELEYSAELKSLRGLGRNWSWREIVERYRDQTRMFDEEDDIELDIKCTCWE